MWFDSWAALVRVLLVGATLATTEKLGDGWALADVAGAGGVRRES